MRILNNTTGRQEWLSLWDSWDGKEIYAHPDYIELYTDCSSEALCAVMESADTTVIYPFIKRSLSGQPYCEEELYDLTTAYGYGGIYVIGRVNKTIIEQFCFDFAKWAEKNNVVCEFIRFALDSNSKEFYRGEVALNNQNIVVDLTLTPEQMWSNFKHKVRKNVNCAKRLNLIVDVDTEGYSLNDFLHIYYDTMCRRSAAHGYYFPKEYFNNIVKKLKGQFAFFNAKDGENIVSTELILISDNSIYSFLGGTIDDFFAMRPNDLLKFEIINWGRLNGKKRFVLGGGYVPMDGIFQYKQAFSKNGIEPFYIGKQIFMQDKYNQLVTKKREIVSDWNSNAAFFPLYRI